MASDLEKAIHRVLDNSWQIMGPEVEAFEGELACLLRPYSRDCRWQWH